MKNIKTREKKYKICLSKKELNILSLIIKKSGSNYKNIISGMHKNKTMQEIANDINKTKQAVHLKIKKLYSVIEKKEDIAIIIKEFDTYININKNIEIIMENKKIKKDDMELIIKKLLLYKIKNTFEAKSNKSEDIYIVDKRLHFKMIASKTVVSRLIQEIKKYYIRREYEKLKYTKIADELGLDAKKLKDVLNELYNDKLFFIEPYILPIKRNGVFTAMHTYVDILNNCEQNNNIEVEKIIEMFMDRYKEELAAYGIENKAEMIKYIKTRRDLPLSLLCR